MEQLWAIFSTLWKNQRQKFHTVENISSRMGGNFHTVENSPPQARFTVAGLAEAGAVPVPGLPLTSAL